MSRSKCTQLRLRGQPGRLLGLALARPARRSLVWTVVVSFVLACASSPSYSATVLFPRAALQFPPLPDACKDERLTREPSHFYQGVPLDTAAWRALSGQYSLFLLPRSSAAPLDSIRFGTLVLEVDSAPPPALPPLGTSQGVGHGILILNLRGLSIGDLTEPVPTQFGLGFPFTVGRSALSGGVRWGVASRGLDSGIGFRLVVVHRDELAGWWYDAAGPSNPAVVGVFCGRRASPANGQ